MALLVFTIITGMYALVVSLFHMELKTEVEELRIANDNQARMIRGLKIRLDHYDWKQKQLEANAEADMEVAMKDKERLLEINNKLMEKLKESMNE